MRRAQESLFFGKQNAAPHFFFYSNFCRSQGDVTCSILIRSVRVVKLAMGES